MSQTIDTKVFVPTPEEALSTEVRQTLLLRSFTDQLYALVLGNRFSDRSRITVPIPRDTSEEVIDAVTAILVDRHWAVEEGEVGIDMSRTSALVISKAKPVPAAPPAPVPPPAPYVVPPTKLNPADDMEGGACVVGGGAFIEDEGGASSFGGGAASIGGTQNLS